MNLIRIQITFYRFIVQSHLRTIDIKSSSTVNNHVLSELIDTFPDLPLQNYLCIVNIFRNDCILCSTIKLKFYKIYLYLFRFALFYFTLFYFMSFDDFACTLYVEKINQREMKCVRSRYILYVECTTIRESIAFPSKNVVHHHGRMSGTRYEILRERIARILCPIIRKRTTNEILL